MSSTWLCETGSVCEACRWNIQCLRGGPVADRILYPNRPGVIVCQASLNSDRLWKSKVKKCDWCRSRGLERLEINSWLGFIAVKSSYVYLALHFLARLYNITHMVFDNMHCFLQYITVLTENYMWLSKFAGFLHQFFTV